MAYVLLAALRRIALAGTRLAKATCASIRLKLLKIGAQVRRSARRIRSAMASACPMPISSPMHIDDYATDTSGLGARLLAAIRRPHIVAPALSRGPALPAQPAEASTGWTPDRRSAPSGVTRRDRSCRPATLAPAPPDCRGTRSPSSVPANDRRYDLSPRPQLNPPVSNKETYPGRQSASRATDTLAPSAAENRRPTPMVPQTDKTPINESPVRNPS